MNGFAELVLGRVIRVSCLLSIAFVVTWFFCSWWKTIGNQTRILAWFLVIASGCLLIEIPVEIAWYPAPPESTSQIGAVVDSEPLTLNASELTSPVTQPTAVQTTWVNVVFAIWIGGGLLCLGVSMIRCVVLTWCVHRLSALKNANTTQINELRSLLKETGVNGPIGLLISTRSGPFVCRLWRQTVVVVPETLWRTTEAAQRKAILRHELHHVRRLDLYKVACARWLVSLQWFNPLAWLALAKFCESIEFACDESARGDTHAEQIEYSKALLMLIELRQLQPRFSLPTLGANGSPLVRRFEQILKPKESEMKLTRMLVGSLLITIAMFGVLRVQLVAQEKQPVGTPQEENTTTSAAGSSVETNNQQMAQTYSVADLVVPVTLEKLQFDGEHWVQGEQPATTNVDYSQLTKLIQDTIDPDSWFDNGGTGRIASYDSTIALIITQSQQNHVRIQNLLARLRDLSTVTLLFEGNLVVMSNKDFADSNLKMDESQSVISVHDARLLTSFAKVRKHSACYDLPRLNIYNGQSFHFEVSKNESGVCDFGGVDFEGLGFRGVKMASEDVVMFQGLGNRLERKKDTVEQVNYVEVEGKHVAVTGSGKAQPELFLFSKEIPDGGFIAMDVTDRLIEKDGRRAFLILHLDIRKWQ